MPPDGGVDRFSHSCLAASREPARDWATIVEGGVGSSGALLVCNKLLLLLGVSVFITTLSTVFNSAVTDMSWF